ncbi:proprotein convertase subtilisin/kexin type 5-like [Saccostrea cucullata]|uniref:proprotein convertase subtilisin/kexin type 5-like n=1 Tax=Saccostrea cuccullata TaxID=36930 RepID=UPI002ED5E757
MEIIRFVLFITLLLQKINGYCLPYESDYYDGTYCLKICPHETVLHRGHCIKECPDFSQVLSNGIVRYCNMSSDIPCSKFLCSSHFPYCYESNCLKFCPEFTVAFNGICLMRCPLDAPYLTTPNCKGLCLQGEKFCNSVCSTNKPYTLNTGHFIHCLTECPDFTSRNGTSCNLSCPESLPFLFNRTCFSMCPKSANYVILKRTKYNSILSCIEQCPSDLVTDNNTCVKFCPPGKHLFNDTCVTECPNTNPFIYPREFTSIPNIKNFGKAEFMCVDSCTNPSYKRANFTCVVKCNGPLKYNLNGVCVEECPSSQFFVDMQTYDCLSQCQSHHHQHGNFCTTNCPDTTNKRYNGSCVDQCPEEAIFEQSLSNLDLDCVSSCRKFYFKQRCVDICPSIAKFIVNASCIIECPTEVPYVNIIHSQEKRYPYTQHDYMYCVENCPSGYFFHKNICVKSCPSVANLVLNSTCVSECSLEKPFIYINYTETRDTYRSWELIKTEHRFCLEYCPKSYITNGKMCVTSCPKDKVLFQKTCLEECPPSKPLTYIENKNENAKLMCVSSCPKGTHSVHDKCYDHCPFPLGTFLWNCTDICPSSHQLRENQTIVIGNYNYGPTMVIVNCVDKCSRFKVSQNNTCQNKCFFPKLYIDKSVCVDKCSDEHHYFEVAPEGKRCHIRCPRHLFYLEGTYQCVQNCEAPYLIVDNKCQNIRTCPNHALTEHTNRGVRCTNKCSPRFFLDGTKCLEECPGHKVIIENICAEHCPYTHPYEYKNDRIHCMNMCPDDYVANKISKKCISNEDCHRAGMFSFYHVCHDSCPFFTYYNDDGTCSSSFNFVFTGSVMYFMSTINLFILYLLFCYSPQQAKEKCTQNDQLEREEDISMDDSSTSDL